MIDCASAALGCAAFIQMIVAATPVVVVLASSRLNGP